jgi:osmoprotectant transport system ATP-binding protein
MTVPEANAVEFSNVAYHAGDAVILRDVSFTMPAGETLVMLGRSGSGKTTALKLINRLLSPSHGAVLVEGTRTTAWDVIRLRRRIGYAIQEVGLFPHYTAEQNIGLLPALEGWPKARIAHRVRELLELVGLTSEDFRGRYPDELSGGQRQRVGFARALALDPPILLMDEPFGALDPITRAELQTEVKRLIRALNKTVAFVTHDTSEALLLADRIAVLDAGRLEGVFTPQEFLVSDNAVVKQYRAARRASEDRMGC